MDHHNASILLIEIHKSNYNLSPRETGIIQNIVARISKNMALSEKQSWSLQKMYRLSQGAGKKLWSRIEKK